jgi:5S rRNA maturation endonuclease (ribonuclease M5)
LRVNIPGIRIHKPYDDRVSIYCPIHKEGSEKRPAAYIYFGSGTWRCHACGRGGKIEELLEQLGIDSSEAGRVASDLRSLAPSKQTARIEHPACPEFYLGAFNRRPLNLINAGYTRKVLDDMEVGFDDVRKRVIYTVRSMKGVLHGVVGGAVVKEMDPGYFLYYSNEPKYLAFGPRQGFPFQVDPKWTLWNGQRVAKMTDHDRPVVVVEGFKALMWVLMAGYDKVVATFGAAYEQGQVELIGQLGCPVLLFLDNDTAGRYATRRLRMDLRKRMSGVGTVRYPRDARQPDDLTFGEVIASLGLTG